MISIVIPNCNSGDTLDRLLVALAEVDLDRHEIIVVDDSSTDDSFKSARSRGVKVYRLSENSGPAAARNYGARHAKGEILWFLDSDVEPMPGGLEIVDRFFAENPGAAAAIGSYDDAHSHQGLCSQFKNLFHHYVHHNAGPKVSSFWSGCGAVRRSAFDDAGGFDNVYWRRPMIEDIHFGYALGKLGHEIHMLKGLQVKHHKKWTLPDLIRTDIFRRAAPWTVVLLRNRDSGGKELNLNTNYRASVAFVFLALLFALAGFICPWSLMSSSRQPCLSLMTTLVLPSALSTEAL